MQPQKGAFITAAGAVAGVAAAAALVMFGWGWERGEWGGRELGGEEG